MALLESTGKDMTEQLALPDQPGTITGTHHPITSHQAAERILPRTGTQRRLVLSALSLAAPFNGFTDEELQDRLGMNPSSERPRRIELLTMGWIEDSGETRVTRSGAKAIVWKYVL